MCRRLWQRCNSLLHIFMPYSNSTPPKKSGRWKSGLGKSIGKSERKCGCGNMSPHLYTLPFAVNPSKEPSWWCQYASVGTARQSCHVRSPLMSSNGLRPIDDQRSTLSSTSCGARSRPSRSGPKPMSSVPAALHSML